ncbi:hypothetical protein MVLG_06227 [Microbotryum lychnidis-dioicae p1A1 Lamole]|uniref:Uncharacterized protein n=1 Tax=Microbotryum lychnidis-dioicae (strain p1A1 Lamole / MvSl-1064) TaxID=683840 RepID=U5HGM2_USTV1|nr:hypothetical protein MVLG_06227 [Microbotryum lychnidis-dioicae p1A1 Lamole]|eukprot:KDE03270.1 hypothetical protein MVLG_06227 [Microbotryum lychnidis-dioicae p1A1 Lamole]
MDVCDRVTNEEFTTMLVDGKEADGLHTLAKLKAQRKKRDFVEFFELEHCLKQIQAVGVAVFCSLTHGGKDWEHYMKFLRKLVMTEGYGTAFVVRYDAAFQTERAAYGSRLI